MEAKAEAGEVFGKWDWWRDPKAYENPADAGPPYTLEALNHLTGARVHTKATQHQTLESANTSAALRASQVRKFVTINVLDRRSGVVATHKGQH